MVKTAQAILSDALLPLDVLQAMVEGTSPVDSVLLDIPNREAAEAFALQYGYDINDPSDREELKTLRLSAIQFVNQRLLRPPSKAWSDLDIDADLSAISSLKSFEHYGEPEAPANQIPAALAEVNTLDLLMIAAGREVPLVNHEESDQDQHWACAILKVMHAMSHIQNFVVFRLMEEARRQILRRFQSLLTVDRHPGHEVILGKRDTTQSLGNKYLRLFGFQIKEQKSFDSILIKLLCKRDTLAEEVMDFIGIRLVTYTAAEAMLALDILHDSQLLRIHSIIPSRSRNSLINFEQFKTEYEASLKHKYPSGLPNWDALKHLVSAMQLDPPTKETQGFNHHNQASSEQYRSIHLTSRQLIHMKEANFLGIQRFFFPFEIQIMDKDSYEASIHGDSSHVHYKQRQLFLARRRVLGPLLKGEFKGSLKSEKSKNVDTKK